MPYVLLQHKQTGVQAYFSTFHNPANIGGNMQRHRNEATRRQINLFNQLEAQRRPAVRHRRHERARRVLLQGDRRRPRWSPLPGAPTTAAARRREPTQIDWIFGSPGAQWTNYLVDRSPLVRRTTDHPVIVASVMLDALKFENAYDPNAPLAPATPES